MTNDRATLLHEWFEQVWNQGDITAIDRLLGPDAIAHGLVDDAGNEPRGAAAFKSVFHKFRGAFPDIHIDIEDSVVEGDRIAVRCTVRGTHHGDTLGMPATKKPVSFTGMCMVRVRDGKIVEGWNSFDFAGLNAQLQ